MWNVCQGGFITVTNEPPVALWEYTGTPWTFLFTLLWTKNGEEKGMGTRWKLFWKTTQGLQAQGDFPRWHIHVLLVKQRQTWRLAMWSIGKVEDWAQIPVPAKQKRKRNMKLWKRMRKHSDILASKTSGFMRTVLYSRLCKGHWLPPHSAENGESEKAPRKPGDALPRGLDVLMWGQQEVCFNQTRLRGRSHLPLKPQAKTRLSILKRLFTRSTTWWSQRQN